MTPTSKPSPMTSKSRKGKRKYYHANDIDPVHSWFSLSYGNYFVCQRSVLQSMPLEWQKRFVKCLEELDEAADSVGDIPSEFWVRARKGNKFIEDKYRSYRHTPNVFKPRPLTELSRRKEEGSNMKLTEKLDYLQTNHFGEWLKTRREVEAAFLDSQPMFCVCGGLATGLHERNCRKLNMAITKQTVKRMEKYLKEPMR